MKRSKFLAITMAIAFALPLSVTAHDCPCCDEWEEAETKQEVDESPAKSVVLPQPAEEDMVQTKVVAQADAKQAEVDAESPVETKLLAQADAKAIDEAEHRDADDEEIDFEAFAKLAQQIKDGDVDSKQA